MNKSIILGLVFSASVVLFLSGCGASGQQFSQFSTPKPDKALVYVYRPSAFVGGGVYYNIHVTNTSTPDFIAGELVNGSYLQIDVPAGENELWGQTESKSSVTIDAKKGEIYCVKGGVGIGFIVGRPSLDIVDMTTCKTEIIETKQNN
ncbi:MAG: DUF2846 domain-containing protein [Erysipelotrichia bacterium]|nr:DUF2846 domain-containing protein [Erysipelotrichia bacterium]